MTSRISARSTSRHLGEEGVDGAEEEPLIVVGEAVDLSQPAQEAAIDALAVVVGRLDAEDLVGRSGQDLGEADEQRSVETQVAALVLGDQRGMDAEALGDLDLAQPAAFPNLL